MNKLHGIAGRIIPSGYFQDDFMPFAINDFEIKIARSFIEITFDTEQDSVIAEEIGFNFINAWSLSNNIGLQIDWDRTWKENQMGGRDVQLMLADNIQTSDSLVVTRTTNVKIKGVSRIISATAYDSNEIETHIEQTKLACRDKNLSLALSYFQESLLNDSLSMVGLHKALEQIINVTPGKTKRKTLTDDIGYDIDELNLLMTSLQTHRHSEKWLGTHSTYQQAKANNSMLSKERCRKEASKVIKLWIDYLKRQ
jgi:hypothetical protein